MLKLAIFKADSRLAPSQWETPLQSNALSHWLGANLESALISLLLYIPGLLEKSVCLLHGTNDPVIRKAGTNAEQNSVLR